MNIGIVGSGKVGFGMGSSWAEKGHRVCFSYSRSPSRLQSMVASASFDARVCSPAEAATFGEVVVLAIHWPQVPLVLSEIVPYITDKPLLTCVVPWNSAHTDLSLRAANSAAEEIARLAPDAHVVEALPLLAEGLYAPCRFIGGQRATLFYCGAGALAKETVAGLLEELGVEPVDAGELKCARLLEPCAALLWHLAVAEGEGTDIALKLLRR